MLFLHPRVRGVVLIAVLLSFGIIASTVLELTGSDVAWVSEFFVQGGKNGGWAHARDNAWGLLYDYGEVPGIVLAIGSLVLYVASKLGRAPKRYAKPSLVVILTVIIGPGILVNGVLKNCWGRPRPVDVRVFGGPREYRKVWEPGVPGQGKSFTCGHCSMAFSVGALAAFYPYHPLLACCALATGVAFGTLTGIARMAQGGHFPTDVVWSGIIVFIVIAALYYLVFRVPEQECDPL